MLSIQPNSFVTSAFERVWKRKKNTQKYATHLRLVTVTLLWRLTKYVSACSSGNLYADRTVATTETMAIQLLAKSISVHIWCYDNGHQRANKMLSLLANPHFCSPRCCGCHLESRQWELLRVQTLQCFMRDRMNMGHAVGQRGTFLSSFLNSAGMKTSESVAFSMSDNSVIHYTYRG